MGRHSAPTVGAHLACGVTALLLSVAVPSYHDTVRYLREQGVPLTPPLVTQLLAGEMPAWLMQDAYASFVRMTDSAWVCYHQVLRSYAEGRVVPLRYAEREPGWFGMWDAPEDLHTLEADTGGQVTEWEHHYYVAHDWSEYGQMILDMVPGDKVGVNGVVVRVEGAFDYPKDGFYDEIRELVGPNHVVFQTCEPNSDLNRIVWCR